MSKLQEILEELVKTIVDAQSVEAQQKAIALAISAIEGLVPSEKDDYRDFEATSLEQADGQLIGWNACREEMLRRVNA